MRNSKIRSVYTVLFCLLFSSVGISQVTQEQEQQIDEIFEAYDDLDKPGCAVAVVQDGKIIYRKGYGSANLEYRIPNSPSTVFHIASVSKQFTVFSVMLLQEEGLLSLDDDIRKYIPEVPDFGEVITLRHLAAHTSGMRDQWDLLSLSGWRWDDVITKEHVLKIVSRQEELNFTPGDEFTYCNTGFTILAEVVSRVANTSFAEFTQERIFQPLGMTHTLFYDDHERIVPNRAYSYHTDGDGYKKTVLSYANVGATSLFTTVDDLSLWAMNFESPVVGNNEIFNQMNTLATLNNGETFGGAYGQFVNTYKGHKQIQHGGADAGYRTYLGRFPDDNFAVMVFSNLASSNPNQLSLQVADVFLTDNSNVPENSGVVDEAREHITLTNAELTSFEGRYWNAADAYSRKLYVRNDTMMYWRGPNSESPLIPISSNAFVMLNVDVDLVVSFEENRMIVTIDNGDPIVSEKYIPADYSNDDLNKYTGTFYSSELDTYYRMVVRDGNLTRTHYRMSDAELRSVKEDVFDTDFGTVVFVRDDGDAITGLTVTTGRVRDLKFVKVDQNH